MIDTTNLASLFNMGGAGSGWSRKKGRGGQGYGPSMPGDGNMGYSGQVGYQRGWQPPGDWGAYSLWAQGSPDYDPREFTWGGETPQDWWRSPGMQSRVSYNDYWGWQDPDSVRDWYRTFEAAPSSEQFLSAPWTQNVPDPLTIDSWRQYGFQPFAAGGSGGGGGSLTPITQPIFNWGGLFGNNPESGGGDTTSNWTGSTLNPQYPGEWNLASNVLGQYAMTGMPTPIPELWQMGGLGATNMAATGLPTSYEPWYQEAKKVAQTDIEDAIKQAAEQANLTGLRWSTPLGRTAQDIAGRRMTELGAEWTGKELGAQEAARARQMEALNQMYQYGAGGAGLAEASAGRGLQAASALPGLGSMYAQLPLQMAQQAMGMGGALQGAQQSEIGPLLQEYMRLVPEASPWLQYALQAMGMPVSPTQATYNPGCMTQGMNALCS